MPVDIAIYKKGQQLFDIFDRTSDVHVQILQQCIVLLLSSAAGKFRKGCGTSLITILQGTNMSQSVLGSYAAAARAQLLKALDKRDLSLIKTLTLSQIQNQQQLLLTITFNDGVTVEEIIA